jgi:hypothetical protein
MLISSGECVAMTNCEPDCQFEKRLPVRLIVELREVLGQKPIGRTVRIIAASDVVEGDVGGHAVEGLGSPKAKVFICATAGRSYGKPVSGALVASRMDRRKMPSPMLRFVVAAEDPRPGVLRRTVFAMPQRMTTWSLPHGDTAP